MTDSEQARIAVLETQVNHLNDTINRMSDRQDEMYDLMMQTKGGWRTLAVLAGLSGVFGGVLVKIFPLLTQVPK